VANFALHNSELPAITRKAPLNQDKVQILIDFLDMFYVAAFVGGHSSRFYSRNGHRLKVAQ